MTDIDLDAIRERAPERPYCSYIRSLRVILTPGERDALVGRIQELNNDLSEARIERQLAEGRAWEAEEYRDEAEARAVKAEAHLAEAAKVINALRADLFLAGRDDELQEWFDWIDCTEES